MAYYDIDLAQDFYGETEEERRRRLAAEQPVTQKITYNPDGTQKMTITGTPESLSAANPLTPTVTGPVAPQDIQPEPEPQPGVMPQQQSGMTPQLSPQAGNNIQDYIQRLYDRRMPTQQAQPQAQPQAPAQPIINDQGQMLGRETPEQMMAGAATNAPVTPVQPQTGMMPVSAPAPQAQPQGYGPGVSFVPSTPEDVYAQRFREGQTDPIMLAQIKQDTTAPDWVKRLAAEQSYDMSRKEVEEKRQRDKIQQDVDSGNFTALGRALQQKNTEGSFGKYILYGLLGSERLAKAEANKLGIGSEWKSTVIGDQPSLIKLRADGLPMEGYNSRTGQKLTAEELSQAAGYMTQIKGAQAGSTVFRDPGTGKTLSKVDTPQGPIYYDKSGTRVVPKGEPFPLNTGSNLDLQNQLQIQSIRNKIVGEKAEQRIKTIESINAIRMKEGLPLFSFAEIGIDERGNLLGFGTPAPVATPAPAATTTPAATTAPAAPAATTAQQQTAPAAPAQQRPAAPAAAMQTASAQTSTAPLPGESTGAYQRRMEAQGLAQKKIAESAGEVVAASQETQNLISKIDTSIVPIIDSGKHNIGSTLSGFVGRGPIAQAIGGQFETEDARNTRTVMETIDMLAIEGLKSLGANPSTRDLEFYTKNKPQANSDPEFVKSWIQSRSAALKRKLGYAGSQVGAGGAAGTAPPVSGKPSVSNW